MNRREFIRSSLVLSAGRRRAGGWGPRRPRSLAVRPRPSSLPNGTSASSRGGGARSAGSRPRTRWPSWTRSSRTPRSSASRGSRDRGTDDRRDDQHPPPPRPHGRQRGLQGGLQGAGRAGECAQAPVRGRQAHRAGAGAKIDPAAALASQVYADTTFTDVWRRELGSEIVTAEFRGPAHTGGDAVVIFEKANVVHMGDLVFNRMYPYVDRPGGATMRGWIKSLEDSAASYPADAIYVFGHGNPKFGVTGKRGDLLVMRDFLSAVSSASRRRSPRATTSRRSSRWRTSPGFPTTTRPSRTAWGWSSGRPSTN
jgi:glyoxylase-like metal-dependent hydrolase (beta-lactamase superfamily II)